MAAKRNVQTFEKRKKEEKRRRKQEEKQTKRFSKKDKKETDTELPAVPATELSSPQSDA
jgi:hypothetical protein